MRDSSSVARLPLIEKVIGNFYFEIGEIPGTSIFRVAAFVTATKPSITSKPVANEADRIRTLSEMFDRLRRLKDYKVEVEAKGPLTAQGSSILVSGIRANVSRRDGSRLTCEDVVRLVEQGLVPPTLVVTIDTNSINTRQSDTSLNKLEEWHLKGIIEIVRTDVMDTEFLKRSPEGREAFVNKSSRYREDVGVGIYEHSRRRHAVYGEPHDPNYPLDEMLRTLFPQFENLTDADERSRAIRDAMHLATHYMHKRDFFVTNDPHFIAHGDALKESFGVVVLTPAECVSRLSEMLSPDKKMSQYALLRRGADDPRP